ncbi:MAG: ATP-dependent RecD-like DNA helicase, partial [Bradymonadaceae bacterium]
IIERASFEELTAEGVELYSDLRSDRTPIELLGDWYEDRLAKPARHAREEPITVTDGSSDSPDRERVDALFEGFGANQLLAVSRRRPRGVERLDAELHRRHVEAHDAARDRQFVTGEPVMMTTNDYERGLFNGDRGVILRVRRTPEGRASPRAVFPTRHGYRPFAIGPLARHLDHAWSLTVHKAQGSEFEHVGFVLPDEDIPLLTRELLYTGMTRAERSVVFFGRSELIRRAAARSDERNTGLVERLESTDRPE